MFDNKMSIEKVWDMVRSFPSFEEVSHFLRMYPTFGSELKIPDTLSYRQCITAMLIVHFPDDILSHNEYDQFLKTTSEQLLNGLLQKEPEERIRLRAKAFVHILECWKKHDKKQLLDYLCNIYLSARNTMFMLSQNLDQMPEDYKKLKEEEISELEKYMVKVKKSIQQIDKSYLNEFLKTKKEPEEVNRQVMNHVSQTMYKAFWNKMLEDMNNNQFDMAFANLKEAVETLNKLAKLDFDLDYYKQLVNNKLFTEQDLMKLANFFVSECKKRGAPEDDKYSDDELKKWTESNGSLSEKFVEFLKLLVELLSRINLRLYMLTQKIV